MYARGDTAFIEQDVRLDGKVLRQGTPVEIVGVQDFQGYVLYTVKTGDWTGDLEQAALVSPSLSRRDRITVIAVTSIVGGSLLVYVLVTLLQSR